MYVFNLRDVGKVSVTTGYKAQALKRLMETGLEVPEGFVIAAEAFTEFITMAGINGEIDGLLSSLNQKDKRLVPVAAKRIQELILAAPFPNPLIKAIRDQYEELSLGSEVKRAGSAVLDLIKAGSQVFVAVRPSLPTWGLDVALPTELNVFGVQHIVDAAKKCWASAFYPEYLAKAKGKIQLPAVVIQKMVNAEKSGSLFTTHPLGQPFLLVESSLGLGEWNNFLTPDLFEIDSSTGLVVHQRISPKKWMKRADAATSRILRYAVPSGIAEQPSLDEKEIREIVSASRRLPPNLCVEWALERKKLLFLNVKPVSPSVPAITSREGNSLLEGRQLAGGAASGTVTVLSFVSSSDIKKGDVVIAKALVPELAPTIDQAAGFIVEEGGYSSFGAFYCRERGVPFVVAGGAAAALQEGMVIDIDNGKIFQTQPPAPEPIPAQPSIRLNITAPFSFPLPGDVGLVRPEACFPYGTFPLSAIRADYEQTKQLFQERLRSLASATTGTLWYRLFDHKSDEVRVLNGGEQETIETNPLLGWRGTKRILDQPEVFRFERDCIAELLPQYPHIGIVLPWLSTVDELKQFRFLIPSELKVGVTIATPAAALSIEEFCSEGIGVVVIDIDELSQLLFGVDRNNPNVSKYYSPQSLSLLSLVKQVVDACGRHHIGVQVTGATLHSPELRQQFQSLGITVLSEPP